MIDTRTTWDDTGRDCQHCGGIIYKRTDYETGLPPSSLYQCQKCTCQWSLEGQLLRAGRMRPCREEAQRQRAARPVMSIGPVPRWVIIAFAGGLVLLFLIRFGLLGVLGRLLFPISIVIILLVLVWRVGQQQGWWRDGPS